MRCLIRGITSPKKEARAEDPETRQDYEKERDVFEKAYSFSDRILSFAGRDKLSKALERRNKLHGTFPQDWKELRASQLDIFEMTSSRRAQSLAFGAPCCRFAPRRMWQV